MPASTVNTKATKKKKTVKLVGVDMYIAPDKGIPKFDDYGPFKCEFISTRDTKEWPGLVSPDLLMANWYRCRFMATKDITDIDVDVFLQALSKKWCWSAAQKLWSSDGEVGSSKAS